MKRRAIADACVSASSLVGAFHSSNSAQRGYNALSPLPRPVQRFVLAFLGLNELGQLLITNKAMRLLVDEVLGQRSALDITQPPLHWFTMAERLAIQRTLEVCNNLRSITVDEHRNSNGQFRALLSEAIVSNATSLQTLDLRSDEGLTTRLWLSPKIWALCKSLRLSRLSNKDRVSISGSDIARQDDERGLAVVTKLMPSGMRATPLSEDMESPETPCTTSAQPEQVMVQAAFDHDPPSISFVGRFSQLRSLHLIGSSNYEAALTLPELRELLICSFGLRQQTKSCPIASAPKLERLIVRGVGVDCTRVIKSTEELRVLELPSFSGDDDIALRSAVLRLPRLWSVTTDSKAVSQIVAERKTLAHFVGIAATGQDLAALLQMLTSASITIPFDFSASVTDAACTARNLERLNIAFQAGSGAHKMTRLQQSFLRCAFPVLTSLSLDSPLTWGSSPDHHQSLLDLMLRHAPNCHELQLGQLCPLPSAISSSPSHSRLICHSPPRHFCGSQNLQRLDISHCDCVGLDVLQTIASSSLPELRTVYLPERASVMFTGGDDPITSASIFETLAGTLPHIDLLHAFVSNLPSLRYAVLPTIITLSYFPPIDNIDSFFTCDEDEAIQVELDLGRLLLLRLLIETRLARFLVPHGVVKLKAYGRAPFESRMAPLTKADNLPDSKSSSGTSINLVAQFPEVRSFVAAVDECNDSDEENENSEDDNGADGWE